MIDKKLKEVIRLSNIYGMLLTKRLFGHLNSEFM